MFRRRKSQTLAVGQAYLLAVWREVGSSTQAYYCANAQVKLYCSHRQITALKSQLITQRRQIMNKRIKQLAEQAQQYAEFVTPQGLECFDTFREKFAELIVLECARLVKSAQLTEDGHTWRSADYVVLEHFGVKQ
jgi:hypothetical protein